MSFTKVTITLASILGLAGVGLAVAVVCMGPVSSSEDKALTERGERFVSDESTGPVKKKLEITPEIRALVQTNSAFALDLFARLGSERQGQNLFFSPYSISSALAMVTEGARSETAAEMGKVLRYPDLARRKGEDAKVFPWNMAPIHSSMAALNNHLTSGSQNTPNEVRERLARLREELAAANRGVKQLENENKYNLAFAAQRKAQQIAGEINKLLTGYDQYEMHIANALWTEKSYPIKQSYLDAITRQYRAGIFPVDFHDNYEASRLRINDWVAEQTQGRIKDMIPKEALDPQTKSLVKLILTNAIYFKGEWAEVFQESQTKDDDFKMTDGKKRRVSMMRRNDMPGVRYGAFKADGSFFKTLTHIPVDGGDPKPLYPDERGFTILELPYKGGEVSMVVLLPRSVDGLAALEKQMTPAHLRAWIEKLQSRSAHVFVPRFKLEAEYAAEKSLQEMGMVRAFKDPREPNGAQFEGISESLDPAQKLYISRVLHKAFVEVNEKGTEAAAATAVIVAPPGEIATTKPFTPTFKADQPFAFLIRDVKTGSILFLGRLMEPKKLGEN